MSIVGFFLTNWSVNSSKTHSFFFDFSILSGHLPVALSVEAQGTSFIPRSIAPCHLCRLCRPIMCIDRTMFSNFHVSDAVVRTWPRSLGKVLMILIAQRRLQADLPFLKGFKEQHCLSSHVMSLRRTCGTCFACVHGFRCTCFAWPRCM